MDIRNELEKVINRNKRVEMDKAWETSWTRAIVIAIITYIIAVLWLMVIGNNSPWLNGAVPVAGFILSTLSLPIIKNKWIQYK